MTHDVRTSRRNFLTFDYKIGKHQGGVILQTQIDDSERRAELVKEDFRWFGFMREDMFG